MGFGEEGGLFSPPVEVGERDRGGAGAWRGRPGSRSSARQGHSFSGAAGACGSGLIPSFAA